MGCNLYQLCIYVSYRKRLQYYNMFIAIQNITMHQMSHIQCEKSLQSVPICFYENHVLTTLYKSKLQAIYVVQTLYNSATVSFPYIPYQHRQNPQGFGVTGPLRLKTVGTRRCFSKSMDLFRIISGGVTYQQQASIKCQLINICFRFL